MGNGLFGVDGVDIAGLIAEHLGPRVLGAVLTIYSEGARQSGNLTGGKARTAQTPAPTCRGFWEDYATRQIDGQNVLLGDRKAVLLGDTNPTAIRALKQYDQITMEGVTLSVVRLESRDPAAATFTYQCRDQHGPDGT